MPPVASRSRHQASQHCASRTPWMIPRDVTDDSSDAVAVMMKVCAPRLLHDVAPSASRRFHAGQAEPLSSASASTAMALL